MPKTPSSAISGQYMNGLEPLKTSHVTEMVQERLIQFIRSNDLKAGQKLPSENQLAESLGVSRVTLREALRSMQGLGIVEVKAGLGWYAKDLSFDSMAKALAYTLKLNKQTLADLEEIRINLECSFLEEAIQTLTAEDLKSLAQAVTEKRWPTPVCYIWNRIAFSTSKYSPGYQITFYTN
ncbi:MAG: FadR family transcriptional regulator [Chloroflexi bacterium]|nr:FadR family transcriptional regulator [Chloroflexota bacterium]